MGIVCVTMKISRDKSNRRGQATAEMVIGLVGITVMFFGLVQIAQLGSENIDNLYEARANAERKASGSISGATDQYVRDWRDGEDNLRFTNDDERMPGLNTLVIFRAELSQPKPLRDMLVKYTIEDQDWITPYVEPDSIPYAANLRSAHETRSVPVEEAMQKLLFRGYQSIRLYDEAFMPHFKIEPEGP